MSVGVSAAAGEHASYHRLLKAADEALYRAKREGRNRVVAAGPFDSQPSLEEPTLSPATA
jgi:PleD family two-component response regulator